MKVKGSKERRRAGLNKFVPFLLLVLIIGLYMPSFLSDWFHMALGLLKWKE